MTNGNGIDLQAPLSQMWRDVYKKAGEAAEARATELLKYHVYVYPHGAGGGGGAGNLVLVETQTMADDTATSVAFAGIPAAGAGLLLVVSAHQLNAAGAGSLLLRINDDATTNYSMKLHEVYGTTNPVTHAILGDASSYVPLGRLSIADGLQDPTDATAGIVAFLPGHGISGRRKQVVTLGSAFTNVDQHWMGQYGGEWQGTAAIAKLTLLPSGGSATFGAGSVFSLYQLSLVAGGGGGGGATDVTITTDASLTSTESPANTFALAARVSPDAGNALSLHANGLYATDTGGGGGTGNTTMYTQTGTPTGATNSLWFNPSEAA